MSRKREEKKYHPLDLQKNVGVGIPLPIGGAPIFDTTFTTEEQAISNLKNLLLTRKGERPFQPLFGTMVPSFLFENITTKLLDKLKQGLQKDIEFWLPYINMREIIVEDLRDENRINISFSFSVGESGANQIIIVNVDEQGSLSIA
jgi:phage baseplate assembly protein W